MHLSRSMEQPYPNVASPSRLMGVYEDASTTIGLITNTGMSAAQASYASRYAEDGSAIYKSKQTDE